MEARDVEYEMMVQRATQCALWAMPAVGMTDFKKATKRDVGGDVNEVLYLSAPFDSKHGFLTANDVTPYAWGTLSSAEGPLVVEVPPARERVSYFGTIVNAWDQPIEDVGPAGADEGEGGRYLLLPPGYEGPVPEEGYLVYETDTTEYGFSFRPVFANGGGDADAAAYAKELKIYPLSQADDPPPTRSHDAKLVPYDSLPYYDITFFEDIHDSLQNNPVREQDKVMVALLRSLGIEKGVPFEPTEQQVQAMLEGLELAYDAMQAYFITEGLAVVPLWEGKSNWQVWNFAEGQPKLGFPYETEELVLVDERAGGSYFWITYLPKYLGGGTFYLTGLRDSDGELLDGSKTYRLRVPADTPARDFWSLIVYSMRTKGFVRDQPVIGLSSRNAETLQANPDGSYDLYVGAKAPAGMESNFIPSGGEDFFLLFRLYGPEQGFAERWVLGDLERVD